MAGARDLERAIVDFVGGLPDTNLAVWILDRVGAMPIGPDGKDPSPFGLGDSVASGFEVLIVVACTAALLRRPARSLRPWANLALTLGAAGLTALALLSVPCRCTRPRFAG